MPRAKTSRPDNPFHSMVPTIEELVAELVFGQESRGVKDDHQSVFHEVYERCTHHISLPTCMDVEPISTDCVCEEVSAEAVTEDCKRLGLLACIPFVCGLQWQRMALAEYLKVKAVMNTPLVPAVPPPTRGRPRVKHAVRGVISESHGSPCKRLKKSPYLPVRSSLGSTQQSASRSLFTPHSALPSNSDAAHEDDEGGSMHDDIAGDPPILDQQTQWSEDAIHQLRQQAFTRNLGLAFDDDIPPHVDRNDHTIWFCLPNIVQRFITDNHGNGQSRPLFDCNVSAPVFIQLSVGKEGTAFGTTYICSVCSFLGTMTFPQSVPSDEAMSSDSSITDCCICCRSFLDYIRTLFPEFVGAEDSAVITYLLEHSPSYQGVCIYILACM